MLSTTLRNATVSREISEKVPNVDTDGLFEKLFEFSPDAVLVTDKTGSIVRANAQAEWMFGYDRQELIGQAVEILIPERFRPIHPKHRSDYAAQSRTRPMGAGLDLYARRRDKTEFPVDIMLSPLTLDGEPFTLAVVRDVTGRKQAEQERDRQASIVRGSAALLELAHDSIIVRDLENRITFWNHGAEEQYGWRREEAVGASRGAETGNSRTPEAKSGLFANAQAGLCDNAGSWEARTEIAGDHFFDLTHLK
jgi:PAS domain S-box-containing protein